MHIFLLVISEVKLDVLVKMQHVLLIVVSILLKTFIIECILSFISLGKNSLCISLFHSGSLKPVVMHRFFAFNLF